MKPGGGNQEAREFELVPQCLQQVTEMVFERDEEMKVEVETVYWSLLLDWRS